MERRDYADKRDFAKTPEPEPDFRGDVDPAEARPGESFVIHQHHATRLHFDLRLEMFNGNVPVLVSWAVPKNLPRSKGKPHLAIHVEDHPFDYGSFSGTIPKGNYGAGDVRIFDSGSYEVLDREPGKISFRLIGHRLRASYTIVKSKRSQKDEWLVLLKEQEREPSEPLPELKPMTPTPRRRPFDDEDWLFEPWMAGERALAVCEETTKLIGVGGDELDLEHDSKLSKLHERLVALDGVLDGEIVRLDGGPPAYVAFDFLYLDGKSLIDQSLSERRGLLEEAVVPAEHLQVAAGVVGSGISLFEAAKGRGLKGILAKRLSSRYKPGSKTKDWVEIVTADSR